jgi:hypothetical protein
MWPAWEKVGVPSFLNFLVLRRTFVNIIEPVIKDAAVRAQLAGHSVDVHQNVYQQAQPEVLKREMKKFEKSLQ